MRVRVCLKQLRKDYVRRDPAVPVEVSPPLGSNKLLHIYKKKAPTTENLHWLMDQKHPPHLILETIPAAENTGCLLGLQ